MNGWTATNILKYLIFQHAGKHLKQLAKAIQSPVSNLGVIFGEGTKRAKRFVLFELCVLHKFILKLLNNQLV